MSKFESLKRKARDQIFCGIASGEVEDERVKITIDGVTYYRYLGTDEKLIDELIKKLDKNWEEKHSTANRNAKPKAIFEYRAPDEIEELIDDRGSESYSDISACFAKRKERLSAKYPHYYKSVKGLEFIDAYDVLLLFNITNPCLQHTIKKLLALGGRGHKNHDTDLQDALDTLERYRIMIKEHNSKPELDKYRGKNEGQIRR